MDKEHKSPILAVDIIIMVKGGIVLIKRKYPPFGYAFPGGHVDYGESAPDAARREAKEETGLDVTLTSLMNVYSRPDRDPRKHVVSLVYTATADGIPEPADDASEVMIYGGCREKAPELAFDHGFILDHYYQWALHGFRPPFEE